MIAGIFSSPSDGTEESALGGSTLGGSLVNKRYFYFDSANTSTMIIVVITVPFDLFFFVSFGVTITRVVSLCPTSTCTAGTTTHYSK